MHFKLAGSLRSTCFLWSLFLVVFYLFYFSCLTGCVGTQKPAGQPEQTPASVMETRHEQPPITAVPFTLDDVGPVSRVHDENKFTIYWLPMTMDVPYLDKVLHFAEDYGVDGFQLSDALAPGIDELLANPAQQEALLPVINKMKAAGKEIWYWTGESVPLSPGQNQALYKESKELLKAKYSRLVKEILPGIKGVVLNLNESDIQPDIQAEATIVPAAIHERLKTVTSLLRNGLIPEQAYLAIRHLAAHKTTSDQLIQTWQSLPADVVAMTKVVPHDWQPFYPLNPELGAVGDREQWVEFDLSLECEGANILPYADPYLYLQQLRSLLAKGIKTVCLRLDCRQGQKGKNALDTPWGQLNLLVFSEFKQNPQVTAKEIIAKWEKTQFPGAYKIVELATTIVRRAFFPKKLWYANRSALPEFNYVRSHLTGGDADRLAAWTGLPEDAQTEALADKPTLAWFKEIQAEDLASLTDIHKIETMIGEKNINIYIFTAWKEGLMALKIYTELFRLHKQAYFAIRLFQNNPAAMSKEQVKTYLYELENIVMLFDPLPEFARVQAYTPLSQVMASLKKGLN